MIRLLVVAVLLGAVLCIPLEAEKRGAQAKETVDIKKAALGEPVQIGALYDLRSNTMYHGYNMFPNLVIREKKYDEGVDFELLQDTSSHETRYEFGLGAQLELDFMSGLVKVKGSAEYLQDDIKTSTTVRIVVKQTRKERSTSVDVTGFKGDPALCGMMGKTAGPTHVVTRINYGQRSYFVFEKEAKSKTDIKKIKGNLFAQITSIPSFTIEGNITITAEGERVLNDENIHVKFYGDAILDKVPTNYIDAIKVYNSNEDKDVTVNTAISYTLKQLSFICEKDPSESVIYEIDSEIITNAIKILEYLTELKREVTYLLGTDAAIRFNAIKQKLLIFKNALETFYLQQSGQIANLLPLIKAGEEPAHKLSAIIAEINTSSFSKARTEVFLGMREKEIETIDRIVENALRDQNIRLSDIVSATDNECLFKSKFGVIFALNMLSGLKDADEFISTTGDWNEKNWFDDDSQIAQIADISRAFQEYVQANIESGGSNNNCYMIKLDMLKEGNDAKPELTYNLILFEEGIRMTSEFNIPTPPQTVIEDAGTDDAFSCGDSLADGFILDVSQTTNVDVTNINVTATDLLDLDRPVTNIVSNSNTARVSGLQPQQVYSVSYRYVIRNKLGVTEPTDPLTCTTLAASAPLALSLVSTTENSLAVSWAKPTILTAGSVRYVYRFKDGRNVLDSCTGNTQGTHATCNGLSHGTSYTLEVSSKINGHLGEQASKTFVTAPVAPAATGPTNLQDHRATFEVDVGEVPVPSGVTKELVGVKYSKTGSSEVVEYVQRIVEGQDKVTVDIANFERETQYSVQFKLMVQFNDQLLESAFSVPITVTTTNTGNELDQFLDTLNGFSSSSKQQLDKSDLDYERESLEVDSIETDLDQRKVSQLQQIRNMDTRISQELGQVQMGANVFQRSKCAAYGIEYYDNYNDVIQKKANVRSLRECADDCVNKDSCMSVNYDAMTKECSLMPKRKGEMYATGAQNIALNLQCELTQSAKLETLEECVQKKNYAVGTLSNIPKIASLEDCISICADTDGCHSVTYTAVQGQPSQCSLKRKRGGDSQGACSHCSSVNMACLSGMRNVETPRCVQGNKRFNNHNAELSGVASITDCIRKCGQRDGCEGVSYHAGSSKCRLSPRREGASNASSWDSYNLSCLGNTNF